MNTIMKKNQTLGCLVLLSLNTYSINAVASLHCASFNMKLIDWRACFASILACLSTQDEEDQPIHQKKNISNNYKDIKKLHFTESNNKKNQLEYTSERSQQNTSTNLTIKIPGQDEFPGDELLKIKTETITGNTPWLSGYTDASYYSLDTQRERSFSEASNYSAFSVQSHPLRLPP